MNKVDITPEAVPVEQDTSYVISPPSHVEESLGGCKMARDSIVVFCVDVSGSMCITTEVNAKFHNLVYLSYKTFVKHVLYNFFCIF